jgi:hypothetical protein
VIGRFEGHVAKYLGDGVLAYFSWPIAHQDEAERAVRAGLQLVAVVGAIDAPGSGSRGCEKSYTGRLGEPKAKPNAPTASAAEGRARFAPPDLRQLPACWRSMAKSCGLRAAAKAPTRGR